MPTGGTSAVNSDEAPCRPIRQRATQGHSDVASKWAVRRSSEWGSGVLPIAPTLDRRVHRTFDLV